MKKYDGYALITGGNKGIGYAIAEQLAENNYNLVLVATHENDLERAKEHLSNKYNVDVQILPKDLSQPNSAHEVFNFVEEKGIHVALLVNNAGFGAWGTFEKSDHESDVKMVEVMCRSVVELTHLFLPNMIAKKEGGIIIISSLASRQHFPNFALYSACKSFEASFGITLNFELKSKNIDVLVVSPAVTETKFWERTGWDMDLMEKTMSHPFALKYINPKRVAKEAVNGLGKKVEVFTGNILDRFLFYSTAFQPLKVERWIKRLYLKHVYKIKY